MGYRRWKPNKAQREAYAEKMREAEAKYDFISSDGPIREGCRLTYVDKATGEERAGVVVTSAYGAVRGQHTFTIQLDNGGGKVLVKGRNLYDRLLQHTPGEQSKKDNWR